MKKTKKHITLAIIAILIAALAFGYAYLTTTLTISGVTDIDRNNWDVYFDNIQVTTGSVTGTQVIDEAEITDDTTVEFHVNLKKPGDFYEFTIEARNDGTIDAMINSVSRKLNGTEITTLPAYLNYTVTYEDDLEIEDNHLLSAESVETYKVRVEFKKNIAAADLPSTAQSLTLSFGVEYVQADENADLVIHSLYVNESETQFYLNQSLPNIEFPLRTHSEIAATYNPEYVDYYPYYLKLDIVNNKLYSTYLEAYIPNELATAYPGLHAGFYTFYGNINNNVLSAEQAYLANKETALRMFDSSYCEDNEFYYRCNNGPVKVEMSLNGSIIVGRSACWCSYNAGNNPAYTVCGCYA